MDYALIEAKKNKVWAKKTAKDKEWIARASDMSKEMLKERLEKSASELAKNKADYLKLRASAYQTDAGGFKHYIDKEAREKYKKIVGRYPALRKVV